MTAYLTVSGIFRVKQWREFVNWVKGRSRLLKMAPFDRPYTSQPL